MPWSIVAACLIVVEHVMRELSIPSLALLTLLAILLSGDVLAAKPSPADAGAAKAHPELTAIAKAVSPKSLHEIDAKLVGFGTRSTLSDTKSDTRGIGAARRWVKLRFESISKDCGDCL